MNLHAPIRSVIVLPLALLAVLLGAAAGPVLAAGTCHVWQGSPSPGAPYDTWTTAAHDIQTAINYAASNLATYDNVLVTNGTYAVVTGLVVSNAVNLVSVEGREQTFVTRSAGGTNLLTFTTAASGAVVDGLSFTNAGTTVVKMSRGTLRNCTIANPGSGANHGIDFIGGLVEGCVITNWSSRFGSGINLGSAPSGTPTVRDCLIENVNRSNADNGGAAITMTQNGLVDRCIIRNNTTALGGAKTSQGGAVRMTSGTLRNCLVVGNKIQSGTVNRGGGVGITGGTMENCTVVANTATTLGGGVYQAGGIVRNCIVYDNTCPTDPNLSKSSGAFAFSCIPELPSGGSDTNNTALSPLFVDKPNGDYHLDVGSPAIDSGMNIAAVTNDLEGVVRPADGDNVVGAAYDMGAYEAPELSALPLSCSFTVAPARGWAPLQVAFTANVAVASEDLDRVLYDWEVRANGAAVLTSTNANFATTLQPGLYDVGLVVDLDGERATNRVAGAIEVGAATNYVSAAGSSTHPFDSWEKAAWSVNDAVAAAFSDGLTGATVVVGEGLYIQTNTVTILKPITLVSDKGRDLTTLTQPSRSFTFLSLGLEGAVVDGLTFTNGGNNALSVSAGLVRNCRVSLGDGTFPPLDMTGGTVEDCLIDRNVGRFQGGARVSGSGVVRRCAIINNRTTDVGNAGEGGGAAVGGSGLVENCVITNNTNSGSSGSGGGGVYMSGGTLRNCLVANNRCTGASGTGGGVSVELPALIENCTIAGNSTTTGLGGGLYLPTGTVRNTIVYGNTMSPSVPTSDNVAKSGGTFTYSCSTPLLSGGADVSNTAGDPLYRNAAAGDFSITTGSSALNTGLFQTWMTGATDVAGEPRLVGTVDMGCYELQTPKGTVILVL